MKKLLYLAPLCILCCLSSCRNKKESAYSQLNSLYNDVSMNHEKYSQDDWDKFVRDYERVDSLLGLYEYTPEQYEKIGEMKGRCAAYAAKEYGRRFGRELENKVNEFQGFFEGLLNELNH